MLENVSYLESLYATYRRDPHSVPPEWKQFFDAAGNGTGSLPAGPSFKPRNVFNARAAEEIHLDGRQSTLNDKLQEMVRNYRVRGHRIAAIDPLGRPRPQPQELSLEYYGFAKSELETPVQFPDLPFHTPLTIAEIHQRLRETYCGSIGVQYMHIDDLEARQWLQRRMEGSGNRLTLSRAEQFRILRRLTDAVIFEEFLRKKFLGAKTFSLEGCETLLPLLDLAIEKSGTLGVRDIVIGMAHRGRLNVLSHILGKDHCEIFREFADPEPEIWEGRGDVKYHLGYSSDWLTASGETIHLSLCFNPSHLEFVNPIAMGRVRARQDRCGDRERRRVMTLLIHGDAAFAGEGIIQETLNLSGLPGYNVGGTLHVILNNQIGFTTTPEEGRSTVYATDVAKMLQAPIFHVNGEDPEAVAQVVQLALDFRNTFDCDAFIDMYGYRRWGHNETDEPSFTAPSLYRVIEQRPTVRESYLRHLLKSNEVSEEEAADIAVERHTKLEADLAAAAADRCEKKETNRGIWTQYVGGAEAHEDVKTGIDDNLLRSLLRKLTELPEDFHVHPKLQRVIQLRREMAEGRHPIDWATAEALAFASLSLEGARVRLTGQDSIRGTFSHRHAFYFDYESGSSHSPLQHLSPDQAPIEIHNSPLSEAGVLGFEYGYSLDCPAGLILWEAQYGDFVNAAQVILDQFISSAEDKWSRLSGLVMLLPHGFEGSGPEHSSARLERFLTLAARDNIQIVQPTTAAQYFHLLRRQVLRRWRKPLVIFTPKSLLRHPSVASPLEAFSTGIFHRIIPESTQPQDVKRVLLCSGKVYYDLLAYRTQHQKNDTAILRIEQLYPLREELLEKELAQYPESAPVLWVQEEPLNMGAWRFLHEKFGRHLLGRRPFAVISRPEATTPATGSSGAHKLEQARLTARAFGDAEPKSAQTAAAKNPEQPPMPGVEQTKEK